MSDSTSTPPSSTVTLPSSADTSYWGFKIMIGVSSNDPEGAQIAGLEAKDYFGISEMAGSASFSTVNVKLIKGIVNVVNKIVDETVDIATDEAAAPIMDAWNESLKALEDAFDEDKIDTKVRDGWGKAHDGGYAIDEGGVLVCLPQAGGPLYHDDFQLESGASDGRLPKYYPQGKAFFPCNKPGGLLYLQASEAGTAHVLAYDSKDAFKDNQGAYNIEAWVLRPDLMPAGMTFEEGLEKILSMPPNTAIANPDPGVS
ncbi:hypothetical protein [Lysobacter brunescens]|uniref:Uncharacterized protein n=1 Tax=Lysobacter brunescens TaxID=262323 RepID=A0ABW2Y9H5_9GAMM